MKIKAILMTAAMAFVSTMAMAQAKLTAEPLNVVPGEEFTLPVNMTSDNLASTITMTIKGSEGLSITRVARGESLTQKDDYGEYYYDAPDFWASNGTLLISTMSQTATVPDGEFIKVIGTADPTFTGGTITISKICIVNKAADQLNTEETLTVDVTAVTTGINGVKNVEEKVNAPMYNLAGQRVNANAKGIVIQNGKKRIVK
jgi:hypothetical protein